MLGVLWTAQLLVSAAFVPYEVDNEWTLQGPSGVGRFISAAPWGDKLVVAQKLSAPTPFRANVGYDQPFLIYEKQTGKFLKSFGADVVMNVSVTTEFGKKPTCYGPYFSLEKIQLMSREHMRSHCRRQGQGALCTESYQDLMWVADYDALTVSIVGLEDFKVKQVLGRYGDDAPVSSLVRPAVPASQFKVDRAKFGNPAGIAFDNTTAYISDGEDYLQQINRISAWTLDRGMAVDNSPRSVQWVLPQKPPSERTADEQLFRTPHSIVYDAPSGKLLVGDRGKPSNVYTHKGPGFGNVGPNWEFTPGHSRIMVVDPHTQAVSKFQCPGLELGVHKPPLSLDTFQQNGLHLLFVSVGGFNADEVGWSDEQAIYITDIVPTEDGLGCSRVLQHMPIAMKDCDVMHDLQVDKETGDVYVSCPGCKGERVMRLRPQKYSVLV